MTTVAPPQECGACGMKHYPDEPGFTPQDCAGWKPAIDPHVAARIEGALDDNPTNKTREDFRVRAVLFDEVARHVRAVVRGMLPGITLEFKQQLDQDLGLDAIRARVARVVAGVDKQAQALEARLEGTFQGMAEDLLARLAENTADKMVAAFAKNVQGIVAKEVARQLSRLLRAAPKQPIEVSVKAKKAKKKRKAR